MFSIYGKAELHSAIHCQVRRQNKLAQRCRQPVEKLPRLFPRETAADQLLRDSADVELPPPRPR
jgi:hypothetical protein